MFTVGCLSPCTACEGVELVIAVYQSPINVSDSIQQSNLEFVPIEWRCEEDGGMKF